MRRASGLLALEAGRTAGTSSRRLNRGVVKRAPINLPTPNSETTMLYSDQTLDGLGLFCFSLERASDGFWHTYIICEPIMVGGAPLDRVQGYRLGIAGRELLIAPWPIASAVMPVRSQHSGPSSDTKCCVAPSPGDDIKRCCWRIHRQRYRLKIRCRRPAGPRYGEHAGVRHLYRRSAPTGRLARAVWR